MPGLMPHVEQGPEFVHPDDVQEQVDSTLFIGIETEPERPISMAARLINAAMAQTAAAPVKVKVNEPFRVLHEGVAYTGGDVLEVPNDDEHQTWIKARWVEVVKEKQK